MGFNNSSNLLENRCPNPTTTDCITYNGPDIPCLNIQRGCILSTVECAIATKLCELVGDVDMSSIVIPQCFIDGWGTQDLTILNLIQFILNQGCLQQELLASVIAGTTPIENLNPIITVTYPQCCTPSACGGGITVSISQHLTNVLTCLCNIYTLLGTLPNQYSNFGCAINQLNNSLTQIVNYLNGQVPYIANTISALNAQGYSLTPYSPSTLNPPAGC